MNSSEKKKRGRWIRLASILLAVLLSLAIVAGILVDRFVVRLDHLAMFLAAPDIPERRAGELRVHFVDVGQGDCTIIEFPDGKTMIVDAGDTGMSSRRAVISYAHALDIDTFDILLLTHPDSDHAGGMADVLACYGAEQIWMPYCLNTHVNEPYAAFVEAAAESGASMLISQMYRSVLSDDADHFYYGMILAPLSPEIEDSAYTEPNAAPAGEEEFNDASAVLYIEYAGRRLLLTGDASSKVEDKLVEDYLVTEGEIFAVEAEAEWGRQLLEPRLEGLDFLKAGHHGSSGSTGRDLAELCCPKAFFVSAGADNPYAHPSMASAERVLAASPSAPIWRTDEVGSILLTVRADGSWTAAAVNDLA